MSLHRCVMNSAEDNRESMVGEGWLVEKGSVDAAVSETAAGASDSSRQNGHLKEIASVRKTTFGKSSLLPDIPLFESEHSASLSRLNHQQSAFQGGTLATKLALLPFTSRTTAAFLAFRFSSIVMLPVTPG